jgi:ribosomal protein S19
MPRYKLRVTSIGKNRYAISEADTRALRARLNLGERQALETKIRLRGVEFPAKEKVQVIYSRKKKRGKGKTKKIYRRRIVIPSFVARKAKMEKGKRYVFVPVEYKAGDEFSQKKTFRVSRTREESYTKYVYENVKYIDPKLLTAVIYRLLRKKLQRNGYAGVRLFYLARDTDDNIIYPVFSSPLFTSSEFADEGYAIRLVEGFIADTYDKLNKMLNSDSGGHGIMLIKYTVYGTTIIGKVVPKYKAY